MRQSSSGFSLPVRRNADTPPFPDNAAGWALFLDVDGTLLELTDPPDAVVVPPRLISVLDRLAPMLGGALAVISGRRLDDLDRLFTPLELPAAGIHGLERRGVDGRRDVLGTVESLDPFREPLTDFVKCHDGALVEDKGRALALHYRGAPEAETSARRLVARLMARHGEAYRVIDGKMVFEIKPKLADKGKAVGGFMDEPPFRGRCPVFVGDDVTDEDAFRVVNERGGLSIRVGARPDSAARYQLADVEAVLAWLEGVATSLTDTTSRTNNMPERPVP